MRVQEALAPDLPEILALEESFDERNRWTGGMWAAELGWPDRHVGVVRDQGTLIGAATFQHLGEVVDLHRIVVAQSARRRGLGSVLLEDGISWSKCIGAERILLEVHHENDAAIAFYRHRGFVQIAERRDYYGPEHHALVLGLNLKEDQQ